MFREQEESAVIDIEFEETNQKLTGTTPNTPFCGTQESDLADTMLKYKQLLDAWLLEKEEFDALKQNLLQNHLK